MALLPNGYSYALASLGKNSGGPLLSVPNPLNPFNTPVCVGETFGPNTFLIHGTALLPNVDVTVAALSGFTYCDDEFGTYTSSLTLLNPGGDVDWIIYVKFTPTAAIYYWGDIVVSGGGAPLPVNVGASGTGLPRPVPTITGPPSPVCQYKANTYTTESGMSDYVWSVSTGDPIFNNGTNSIVVYWSTPGAHNVFVNYTNSSNCAALTPTSYSETVNPMPPPNGTGSNINKWVIYPSPGPYCEGSAITFTAPAGFNTYYWTIQRVVPLTPPVIFHGTGSTWTGQLISGGYFVYAKCITIEGCEITANLPFLGNFIINPKPATGLIYHD